LGAALPSCDYNVMCMCVCLVFTIEAVCCECCGRESGAAGAREGDSARRLERESLSVPWTSLSPKLSSSSSSSSSSSHRPRSDPVCNTISGVSRAGVRVARSDAGAHGRTELFPGSSSQLAHDLAMLHSETWRTPFSISPAGCRSAFALTQADQHVWQGHFSSAAMLVGVNSHDHVWLQVFGASARRDCSLSQSHSNFWGLSSHGDVEE